MIWQDSKTLIVKKLNSNWFKIHKLKLWQNSKTQVVTSQKVKLTKLKKNSNCDKTQFLTNLLKSLLVKTTWHLDNKWDVLWAAFCDSWDVLHEFPNVLNFIPQIWHSQLDICDYSLGCFLVGPWLKFWQGQSTLGWLDNLSGYPEPWSSKILGSEIKSTF